MLARATELDRILVTYDTDFLEIADQRWAAGHGFTGIVLGRALARSPGRAIQDLLRIADAMSGDEIRNTVQYIPL